MRSNGRNRQWNRYGGVAYRRPSLARRFFRRMLWLSFCGTVAYGYVLFWLANLSRF